MLDTEKAIEEVEAFRADLVFYDSIVSSPSWHTATFNGVDPAEIPRTKVASRIDLVMKIAEQAGMATSDRIRIWDTAYSSGTAITATDELLGVLRGEERRQAILGPSGPKLAAEQMHRWVWQPAAELWDNGHRREAIQAAATSVFDTHLTAKLGVPRGSKPAADLVTQAFNPSARTGTKCLRLPGYVQGDADWTNAHEGAMHFGRGCVLAIRNIQTHSQSQPDEQLALEALAALSLLARWIETATVVTV